MKATAQYLPYVCLVLLINRRRCIMEHSLASTDSIILCVEDEVDLREILAEEMRDAGYQVIEAADGEEALIVLQHTKPDLILCDILMPRMGGYQYRLSRTGACALYLSECTRSSRADCQWQACGG